MNITKENDYDTALTEFRLTIKGIEARVEGARVVYCNAIQSLVNKHQVHLATGQLSDIWQIRTIRGKYWRSDMDEPIHPIFADLDAIDSIGENLGIGPCNMERYSPQITPCQKKESNDCI